MKKLILILGILLISLIGVNAQEGRICPAVCREIYVLGNNECKFNACGSGCGPDNIKTFNTLNECKSRIIKIGITPPIIKAGITPDSALWGIELIFERLQILFTTDKVKKIELRLKHIEERVEEIKVMVNKNKLKAIGYAEREKNKEELKILKEIEEVPEEIKEKVLENLQKHIIVLKRVREQVPEQAISGIDTAIQRGERNIEKLRKIRLLVA